MADAHAQRDALQATPHHDPIVDEMGPPVAGFLGLASAPRASRVSKAWRRVLGDDLARRQPDTLQTYCHGDNLLKVPLRPGSQPRVDFVYSASPFFETAFDMIAWQPQVLIVQCNIGEPNERKERHFQLLMDLLRGRVPADCYIVASTSRSRHEDVYHARGDVEKLRRHWWPLHMTCVMLRAAKSMPRPSVLALPAHSWDQWNTPIWTFGNNSEGLVQLPDSLDYRRTPSAVFARGRVRGNLASRLFLAAWRRELHRRRPMPLSRSLAFRATLRSWKKNVNSEDGSGGMVAESGMLAGKPADLRVVKWWFLAVDHHGVPMPREYDSDEMARAIEPPADQMQTDGPMSTNFPFYLRGEREFAAHRWFRFCEELRGLRPRSPNPRT